MINAFKSTNKVVKFKVIVSFCKSFKKKKLKIVLLYQIDCNVESLTLRKATMAAQYIPISTQLRITFILKSNFSPV